ncbi:MAG TPA: glycosyltransferase family 4 protein [Actinopolymorphaceae bacterium]
MRIVAYTNLYMPMCRAGAQTTLRDLLRPLRDRHDITIVVDNGQGRTQPYLWEGIPVLPDARQAEDLGLLKSADLFVTHLQATAPASRIAEAYDIPVIQVLHADQVGEHEYLRHRCDFVVFNSYWLRDSFPEYHGPSAVVYPPVTPEEYRAAPGAAVTLINIADIKGSGVFYALAERFPSVSFLGVIGGYGDQDVRDLPNVTVIDSVDDMREVYGRTRVLLMPSTYESFGRCAIEAAASGIPTIAAPTPGLQESLAGAGIYCDTDDLDAWAARLADLLTPAAWSEASRQAVRRSSELATAAREQMATWCEVIDRFETTRKAA